MQFFAIKTDYAYTREENFMPEILTDDLLNSLKESPNLENFFAEHREHFAEQPLPEYLSALLKEKALKKSAVIRDSMLNEVYAYQIFSGQKTPKRDKLLCLTIAMGLTLEETQSLLKKCGYPTLYAKHQRDCVIIRGILEKKSVMELNSILSRENFPLCL